MADAKGSELEQLVKVTKVVADTGEIEQIKKYQPTDATTNPSLLYKAASDAKYAHLVDDAITYAKSHGATPDEKLALCMDKLAVNFGVEITKIVPGVVSTEVDARLSFDTEATVNKARALIELYKAAGVSKDRILIKVASTWEGIKAVEILEAEGIACNMTLLFCLAQAAAAAEAKATLISPFVGRITDWYKKNTNTADYAPADDPGVKSVATIYKYFKYHGYPTIVMGASFRSKGQVLQLAGCDKLTIAPNLLEELKNGQGAVTRYLNPTPDAKQGDIPSKIVVSEKAFRWAMNEDAMATEKLAEGIRKFAEDSIKLEEVLKKKLAA